MIAPDPFRPLPSKNVTSPLHCLARCLDEVARPFDLIDAFSRCAGRLMAAPLRLLPGLARHRDVTAKGIRKIALPLPVVTLAGLLAQPDEPGAGQARQSPRHPIISSSSPRAATPSPWEESPEDEP